jgi:peroxiredoxin
MEAGRVTACMLGREFPKISRHENTDWKALVMRTRKLISISLVFVSVASTVGVTSSRVPRLSPEFVITQPSGKTTLLSSYKGKVIMLEFFFLRSAECLGVANTMNRLNKEFGARGFQPLAVAFPAPQSDADPALVNSVADYFKLTYPVGYTDKVSVDEYLDRHEGEFLRIPQVVIIDRAGMIRAQTGLDNRNLENEDYLRRLIETLLNQK